MKFLVLSHNTVLGGANVAAERLCHGLVQLGNTVVRACLSTHRGDGSTSEWRSLSWDRTRPVRWVGKAASQWPQLEPLKKRLRERTYSTFFAEQCAIENFDVCLVHNLHPSDLGISALKMLPASLPLIWVLHDTWSFTGRCPYPYDCDRFVAGCDHHCPTPHEYPALEPERIAPAWHAKRRFFQQRSQLAAIGPSAWMVELAKRGFWRDKPIRHIEYGIDTSIFKPCDRIEARRILNLPLEGPLGLVSAVRLDDRRKGGPLLREAIDLLECPLTLCTLGRAPVPISNPRVTSVHLGFRSDDLVKTLIYNAADFLIHPAPVDNLPNVVIEALCCGTPVVAFDACGLPEMVEDGTTGWLVREVAAAPLADAVATAAQGPGKAQMRDACRSFALLHYALEQQARKVVAFARGVQDGAPVTEAMG